MENGVAPAESSLAGLQNVEHRINMSQQFNFYISTQEKWGKKCIQTCTQVCIVVLVIAPKWKQPRCPLAGDQMSKQWPVHTYDRYQSMVKRSLVLIHATTWMSLKSIMLRSQMKDHIMCDSIYVKCLEWADPQRQIVDGQLPRTGCWMGLGLD